MDLHLIKRPTAFLPMLLSVTGMVMVAVHAAVYGTAHEADEGTAAHLFQLLMVVQVPLIIAFAWRWSKKEPKAAGNILVVQGILFGAAILTVALLT